MKINLEPYRAAGLALASVCVLMAGSETAMAEKAMVDEARAHTKSFSMALKSALETGMKSGGPMAAIEVCNDQAPRIAQQVSKDGWGVARTALKVRNADLERLSRAILANAPALRDAPKPQLTDTACDRIAQLELPGNLPQLRALLQRATRLRPIWAHAPQRLCSAHVFPTQDAQLFRQHRGSTALRATCLQRVAQCDA